MDCKPNARRKPEAGRIVSISGGKRPLPVIVVPSPKRGDRSATER